MTLGLAAKAGVPVSDKIVTRATKQIVAFLEIFFKNLLFFFDMF